MNKISLIIKREYLTRVKKKSFIIMSIVGPILMAALIIVPVWLAQIEDEEEKIIAVIDSSSVFTNTIPDTKYLKFIFLENTTVHKVKEQFSETGYYALLYIPHIIFSNPKGIQLFSYKQPSLGVKMHISNAIEKEIERLKLKASGIDEDILKSIKTNVRILTYKWTAEGREEQSFTELAMIVGLVSGILIYMFIFMYGAQVMRGVIEEKTSRIVEVIVSSVRPFQLMMGKIVGVAMVGLTQFLLWIVFTFIIVTAVQAIFFSSPSLFPDEQAPTQNILSSSSFQNAQSIDDEKIDEIKDMLSSIKNIDFKVILGSFLFFFLGGYLLYASCFAAIGSAVDSEADTQQFMIPITIPLILAIVMIQSIIQNPDSQLSFWFSIIPFTSPIIMMVRIPFGVPYSEIALSMILLILTFIATTWLAGKIYRTGILMYGKKINYKELWKWIRYKS